MKLLADLHTHSKHSRFFHGKNSIIEMAFRANELGLQELAITDHSFRHVFRTSKDNLYDARLTIDDLNQWSKTKILLGIEADILDENGTIDIDPETLALIDILVVGYHRMIKTDFAGYFGGQKKTEEAKSKATNAFLNAIKRYPITILSHVDSVLITDLYKIGKACAEKGVLVEINNRHTNWTEKQMNDLIKSECMFVVSSDAHSANDIAEVSHAFDIIKKYNIPTERVANVEFTYDEMTDEHREINLIYEDMKRNQVKKAKLAEEENLNSTSSEFNLSEEMEDELKKIAREQRLDYSRPMQENKKEFIPTKNPKSVENKPNKVDDETDKFLNSINKLAGIFGENLDGETDIDELTTNSQLASDKNMPEDKTIIDSHSDKQSTVTKRDKNRKSKTGTFLDISSFTSEDEKNR